jgi:hypothetical protein
MLLVYSPHAIERMRQRSISFEEIQRIVDEPDGTIRQTMDKTIYFKNVSGRQDNDLAVVAVTRVDESREVLTVMHRFSAQPGEKS